MKIVSITDVDESLDALAAMSFFNVWVVINLLSNTTAVLSCAETSSKSCFVMARKNII